MVAEARQKTVVVFDLAGTLLDPRGKLMPGMKDLLDEIKDKGASLATASNFNIHVCEKALKDNKIYDLFDARMNGSFAQMKPSTEMLEIIAIECDCEPEEMLMVGDASVDIAMANEYGCDAIAVCWQGAVDPEVLEMQPIYVATTVEDLRQQVLQLL